MTAPFDLNLRHLRAVPVIIRLGSVNAAADAEGLTQSALTQGIAKLERQLEAALFERRSDGMRPTPEGRLLGERVDAAFGHLASSSRVGGRAGRGFARPDRLMTATQLRAILALAGAGSLAEAARSTGWSQPAIHRAVGELELIVAVPIVERRRRGIVLTDAGKRLARSIRLAAADLRAAIDELRPARGMAGRLVVGAMPLSRALILPGAIARLLRDAPDATIDVLEGSWRELTESLRDGSIDMMIGALRTDHPPVDVHQAPLSTDRLAVVGRVDHPLASEPDPTIDKLASYPWIVGLPETPLRRHWENMFRASLPPSAPVECGSVMTIRGILMDSDCLTLLSPDQVIMELATGMLALIGPPRADMGRTIGVSTRADWRPTALQSRFLEMLREASERSIIPKN